MQQSILKENSRLNFPHCIYSNNILELRRFLFLLLFSHFAIVSTGQVAFGVRAGANVATTKDLIAFPKNRVGWYSGLGFDITLKKRISLQPEIIYSSKGHKTISSDQDIKLLRLNYLNIPILLNYRFDKRTSILLGPEFGYMLTARWVLGQNNLEVTKQYPPRFDYAASVGMQHYLPNGIGFEIRYNYGFNTLYSIDALGNRYTDFKGANRVFQFGARYQFK